MDFVKRALLAVVFCKEKQIGKKEKKKKPKKKEKIEKRPIVSKSTCLNCLSKNEK